MKCHSSLKPLVSILTDIAQFKSLTSLLSWDQETYMPKGSIDFRSTQLSFLSKLQHDTHNSDDFVKALSRCVDIESGEIIHPENYSFKEQSLLKNVFKDWKRIVNVPSTFMAEYAQTISKSVHIWQEARNKSDYKMFSNSLSHLIDLNKRLANFINPNISIYDVLLDGYEPDLTVSTLDPMFAQLQNKLVPLVSKIQGSSVEILGFQNMFFDEDKQWDFTDNLIRDMGFDYSKGRQDISTHPFTIDMHPSDVRLTTRLNTNDLMEVISSSIHEFGHGLYEQGLDSNWFGTPIGESASLGIHESQSRLWENHVAKSLPFWKGQFPIIQSLFKESLSRMSLESYYRMINKVEPSLIRVESDEVTYNLHILVRYECEKLMFGNDLDINDLPDLWNQLMFDYLGKKPANDAEGILQDVHWSGGSFGYFPTYTLGTVYASQLFDAACKDLPNIKLNLENRNYLELAQWLKRNVHRHGRVYSPIQLIKNITGDSLNVEKYIAYLEEKYYAIYNIK